MTPPTPHIYDSPVSDTPQIEALLGWVLVWTAVLAVFLIGVVLWRGWATREPRGLHPDRAEFVAADRYYEPGTRNTDPAALRDLDVLAADLAPWFEAEMSRRRRVSRLAKRLDRSSR